MMTLTACDNNEGGNDNPPAHTCLYNQEVIEDTYRASDASCDKKASYFYSCICGEKGTDTFEYGNALGHSHSTYIYNDDATCTQNGTETSTCDRCPVQDVREKLNTKLEHNYSENWIVNGSHHWHECSCNNKIDLAEHHFDENYNCENCKKSVSNIAIASYDISKNSDNSIIEYLLQSSDFSYTVYIVGEGEMKDWDSSTSPIEKNNYANRVNKILIDERIQNIGAYAFSGTTILSNPQPRNALGPILSTLLGIVILVKLVQLLKVSASMVVIPCGIVKLSNQGQL